ncbi:hypothetical protein NDU88_010749 [Pleurodeles waltl]|uniref:Uncharacterized protein n=1 Tax=Pleurodeles waltl TaxID=8319 RepID=A0AAV7QWS3_PLEWA|nr:hypothetical protein NDU88_010749 [Pleurodeles waltl]
MKKTALDKKNAAGLASQPRVSNGEICCPSAGPTRKTLFGGAPRAPQWLTTSHLLPRLRNRECGQPEHRPRGLVFPKGERPLEKSV